MKIELPVSLRINKPIPEIFQALVQPEKIRHFFCENMTGEWQPGGKVHWHFGAQRVDVDVVEVVPNELLKFRWQAHFVEYQTEVTIRFKLIEAGVTGVLIHETGWETDQIALKSALDHACGWENMLCSLKGWIEHGVDLRK